LPVALTGVPGHWFAGLGWKPFGFVLLVCLLNGLRRTVQSSFEQFVSGVWLVKMLQLTGLGVILAIPVMLALAATWNRVPSRPWVRYPALALALVASAAVGVAAALAGEVWLSCNGVFAGCLGETGIAPTFLSSYIRYGSLCAVFAVVFVYLRIAEESTLRSQQAEVDRARFVQRMEEARLRMLQAQIEPHFLFNTLANVRRLHQTAPTDGAAMLEHLMRYLAVALPQMRAADSTLDREAELTRSYLEIQRLRMGHRLRFEIDIPESLRASPVPPMMLVTLAENAIKHGLAPLPEGGRVDITASLHGPELQLRVADSGQGFTHSSGGGTGLANIRARLAGMYGAAGRLSLALNAPRGVVATIAVPLGAPAIPRPSSL
jgi:sensor histidine kinase YesM